MKCRNPDGEEEEMLHAPLGSLKRLFKEFFGKKGYIWNHTIT